MSIEQRPHAIAFKAAKEAWAQCEGWDADGARLSAACESYHLAYEAAKAPASDQPAPVMVDLGKCATALEHKAHHPTNITEGGCSACRIHAKAVLDEAGVKYVD